MERIKILNSSDKQDFSDRASFPGEEGNPFDKLLRGLEFINRIPTIIFIPILFSLNGLLTIFNFEKWLILSLFSIIDVLLISLLPFLRISFGSFKSQVFLLTVLRSLFVWFPSPINIIFQILGVFLVIYGFIIEPSNLKIKQMSLRFKKGNLFVTFIHISDIHLEELGIRELKIKRYIKDNPPDFILFTGDFLNLSNIRNENSINQIIEFLNLLNAYAPIYYVTGSPAVDVEETVMIIEKNIMATRINNSNIVIRVKEKDVNIIGLTCTHKPHLDGDDISSLIVEDAINILLYHSPDLVYEIEEGDKIDLMLSGHTHGGQVCLPWFGPLFTGSLYGRKLQSGLYKIHDTLLYISRGIGLEGLGATRVRFLCQPEIIVWKLEV